MSRADPVRIAVVNSKSFGVYTDAVDRLRKLDTVVRIEVPRDIAGRELAEKLRGYHIVVASVTPRYDSEFFRYSGDVVMIVRHGIGYDNIDVRAAEESGVLVARVPGWREREAVAEHAVALMLAALRHVPQASAAVREGRWGDRARFLGRELRGLTVGVVGLGNIGSRVAEIVSRGFGAGVVVYDPYVPREKVESLGYAYAESLADLARVADVISLHAPLTSETYHMLNREVLEVAKDGLVIVNTARGELIDMGALEDYLKRGKIRAVALDVVEGEPIGADHPILRYGNVIVTPHIAAYTEEGVRGMDEAVVEAIVSFLEGRPVDGAVVVPKKPRQIRSR